MPFERKDDWLSVKNGVVLTPALEESIVCVRQYFAKHKHKAFVTSGVRDPDSQLKNILLYAKAKGIYDSYPEWIDGIKNKLKWDAKVPASQEIVSAFKLSEVYWWQRTWSHLLHLNVIINPCIASMCLMDSKRGDGSNRKGSVIPASPHFSGRSWDVGGGDGGAQKEYDILAEAKKDPKSRIIKLTLEVQNNAVHVDIKV